MQKVLQQLVEIMWQQAQQLLVVKPRVVEVHFCNDQVSEKWEQRVGAIGGVGLVHDKMLDKLLLRGQHLRAAGLVDFTSCATGPRTWAHVGHCCRRLRHHTRVAHLTHVTAGARTRPHMGVGVGLTACLVNFTQVTRYTHAGTVFWMRPHVRMGGPHV